MRNKHRNLLFKIAIFFVIGIILNVVLMNIKIITVKQTQQSIQSENENGIEVVNNNHQLDLKVDLKHLESYIQKTQKNDSLNKFKSKIVRKNYDVNCQSIFELNVDEIKKAKQTLNKLKTESNLIPLIKDENFIFNKSMCYLYKSIRGYQDIEKYTRKEEKKFPLAYIILTYNHVEQFER
jgi:hypothetical protein